VSNRSEGQRQAWKEGPQVNGCSRCQRNSCGLTHVGLQSGSAPVHPSLAGRMAGDFGWVMHDFFANKLESCPENETASQLRSGCLPIAQAYIPRSSLVNSYVSPIMQLNGLRMVRYLALANCDTANAATSAMRLTGSVSVAALVDIRSRCQHDGGGGPRRREILLTFPAALRTQPSLQVAG
jgi:hypothetical protein